MDILKGEPSKSHGAMLDEMLEVRFHGRGGQGTVVACEILAKALFYDGKYVQYFPEFGVERRGAPVRAFLRVSDEKIYLRHQIYEPDYVIVLDLSLGIENVISGLKSGGWLIVNSPRAPSEFKALGPFKIASIDGNRIALKHRIGTKAAPIVNTVILGAVTKVLEFSFASLAQAIEEKFGKERKNLLAAQEAYEKVKLGEE